MWFEIHITINTPNVQRFQEVCEAMGVKPIILLLQMKTGDVSSEVMTSYKFQSDDASNAEAIQKMCEQVGELISHDRRFKFVRSKIESSIDHPAAPSAENGLSLEGVQHFETHFEILIKSEQEAERLRSIADAMGVHLSRNRTKEYSESCYVQMCTYRSYTMKKEQFQNLVIQIRDAIHNEGLTLEKSPVIEFAVYDSSPKHDDTWLKS